MSHASKGVSHRQHSIILCSFAYNFISNILYFHGIASGLLRVPVMEDTSSPPTQPKKQTAQSLQDILLKLGPITSVSYDPFQCEPRQTAKPLLPSSFP
jgi:hypothetical protein